jgi:hypothetical protein
MYVVWIGNVIALMSIAFLLLKKEAGGMRILFVAALLVKLIGGISLGLVYTHYYTEGDTFPYFEDAVRLADLARHDLKGYVQFLWSTDSDNPVWHQLNFQQPRAVFLAKVASLLSLLTFDNYWLITCFLSFISFVAAWSLVREITQYNQLAKWPAVLGILFFPSVVFWTSGLVKESLALASVYILVRGFLRLRQKRSVTFPGWGIIVVSLWVLWNLKYYYMAVLLPVLFTEFVYTKVMAAWPLKTGRIGLLMIWVLIFSLPVALASVVHPNFYPERFLSVIVDNHNAFVSISSSDDVVHYSNLKPEPVSILVNSPKALVAATLRPSILEVHNPLQMVASLENALILVLVLTAIISSIKRGTFERDRLGWVILLYSFLLAVFLALSTPNFGTLSRYRVGFLPFFILLITYDNTLLKTVAGVIERRFPWLVR